MTAKHLARVAMLSALCTIFRLGFSGLPNIQPITAIFFLSVMVFGMGEALRVMAVTMVVTSFFLGFGPWVFWQIASFAFVLVLFRLLCPIVRRLPVSALAQSMLEATLAAVLAISYGIFIDTCWALLYQMPIWAYVLNGASFNLAHAVATFFFYPLLTPFFTYWRNYQ